LALFARLYKDAQSTKHKILSRALTPCSTVDVQSSSHVIEQVGNISAFPTRLIFSSV